MRPFPIREINIPDEITPEWFKAMVLQLQPDEGDDSNAEQQIRLGLERKFGRDLADAFDEQLQELLPPNATDDQVRAAASRVTITSEPVREVLRRSLEQGSSLGVSVAFDTLQNIGLGFDFTLAHTNAARWASNYSYQLVQGINATTQARLQTAVNDWFRERTTLPDLVRELEPTFGKRRARLIAQTETTRSAAMGSTIGYQESGVVQQVEWRTAMDERRCVTCAPKEGKRAPLSNPMVDGVEIPAHPGCRCWWVPVIEEPT